MKGKALCLSNKAWYETQESRDKDKDEDNKDDLLFPHREFYTINLVIIIFLTSLFWFTINYLVRGK